MINLTWMIQLTFSFWKCMSFPIEYSYRKKISKRSQLIPDNNIFIKRLCTLVLWWIFLVGRLLASWDQVTPSSTIHESSLDVSLCEMWDVGGKITNILLFKCLHHLLAAAARPSCSPAWCCLGVDPAISILFFSEGQPQPTRYIRATQHGQLRSKLVSYCNKPERLQSHNWMNLQAKAMQSYVHG